MSRNPAQPADALPIFRFLQTSSSADFVARQWHSAFEKLPFGHKRKQTDIDRPLVVQSAALQPSRTDLFQGKSSVPINVKWQLRRPRGSRAALSRRKLK
jgi:hypothetical protein